MERSSAVGEEVLVTEVLEAVSEDGSSSQKISNREPFTSLSQVEADLALARALQQQEHAYLLLHMGADGSDYDTTGSNIFEYDFVHDEEAEEQDDIPELPSTQPHKEDENAAGEDEDGSYGSQDAWQDVDPDNMSYEELVALGEAVGTHSRGLKLDIIAALPYSSYTEDEDACTIAEDPCVICRFEYEEGDCLSTLPCKHQYHMECIKKWLQINKACPICSAEVSL